MPDKVPDSPLLTCKPASLLKSEERRLANARQDGKLRHGIWNLENEGLGIQAEK
jgi:hypothetical protein